MQAVQLQQVLPQIQQAPAQKPVQSAESSSFMDELKARISEADNAKQPQKAESASQDDTAERSRDALATTSEDLKEVAEDDTELTEDAEKLILPVSVQAQLATAGVGEPQDSAELSVDAEAVSAESDLNASISSEELAWLSATDTDADADIELSEQDIASLSRLAKAEKAGVITDTASEQVASLEIAQEFSVQDPKSFLAEAEKQSAPALEAVQDYLSDASLGKGALEDAVLQSANAQQLQNTAPEAADSLKNGRTNGAKDKKSDAKLSVLDLRSANPADVRAADTTVQRLADKKEFNAAYQRQTQDTQITLELGQLANQNITASDTQSAAATGSTFQAMLTNTVQSHAPDFVRAGSIVLRDNNQGSINLILHPESLGNVKIHLSLTDKVITGQITVHSQEAFEAFRESIAEIKQAFAQSGFDTGSFDLNFAGNNSFAESGNNSGNNAQDSFKASAAYGDFVNTTPAASEIASGAYSDAGQYSVDIVA